MGIIHKLSIAEAQKIAAGEVVERPYNIVKELVENALDAQATEITLYIEDGGKRRIQCIDNGIGMDEADARMCIEPHATSKLVTVADLEQVSTYGFRGEALGTIAAIAQVTLHTQQAGAPTGTTVTVAYGQSVEHSSCVRAPGTEIIVEHIFAQVPARKKFLKTRETEWRAIYTLVQALALAYPAVRFTLHHDHTLALSTYPTASLSERVAQLFDGTLAQHIVTCTRTNNGIAISGAITRQEYSRFDKQQQFFFVNKRWIRNYKLGQALVRGYSGVLPAGKFPAAFIFIEIPTTEVDINVHPRKEEVVFLHPRLVEQEITQMVQKQLASNTAQQVAQVRPVFAPALYTARPSFSWDRFPQEPFVAPSPDSAQGYVGQAMVSEVEIVRFAPSMRPGKVIGQALQTYILVESPEGIVLVDQHAAHEAVLFEQFSTHKHDMPRVRLLFPEIVPVSTQDQELLLPYTQQLSSCGIVLESAGPQALVITETPVHLKNYNFKELVHDLLGWLEQAPRLTSAEWHTKVGRKLFAMMACKAAVKAHDELSVEKMQEIITLLHATEHRQTCPHGRPTTWLISQYELEKRFKRAT